MPRNVKIDLTTKDKNKVKDKKKKQFDFKNEELKEVFKLYELGCTDKQIMNKYGISSSCYYEWKKRPCRLNKDFTNGEMIQQHKADMEISLFGKAFELALKEGNVNMLKFVMANKLGWSDKVEQKVDTTQSVSIIDNSNDTIETLGDISEE